MNWFSSGLSLKGELIAEILTTSQIPPRDRTSIFNLLTELRDKFYGRDEDRVYELLDRLLAHFAPPEP